MPKVKTRIAAVAAAVAAAAAALSAAPVAALNCTPCGPAVPPQHPSPLRTSDYQRVNVIGGVKDVFNTHQDMPRWNRVRQAIEADAMRADPRMQQWTAWAERLRSQPPSARLAAINARVNQRLRYVPDSIALGVPDHWQTPLESVVRATGDCEDYAILKYYLALQAGIGHEDLAIVVGRIVSTGELHAVLVARSERGWRLLDNRTNVVIDLGGRADLGAIYFVDVREIWVPVARGRAR